MKIRKIIERTVKVESNVRNARVDLGEMTTSAVAIVTDIVRDGRPVVGFAFNSFGRYACGGTLRERFIPRVLQAYKTELLDATADNFDPAKLVSLLLAREKAGGHAERSMAIGTLEIALWDVVAKIEGQPLYRVLADRFAPAATVASSVATYAAGGFYGAADPVASVRAEVGKWRELGFIDVKIKGGDAQIDPQRIEGALAVMDGRGRLALDLSCAFDAAGAVDYARLVKPYDPWWIEEPCDPLDDQGYRAVSHEGVQVAGGENLFAAQEFDSFLTHARLPGPVVLMPDPPFVYGLTGLVQTMAVADRHAVPRAAILPHGGNMMSLHAVAGLSLGAVEAYPGQFGVFGGFSDEVKVREGRATLPESPGIGFEEQPALYALFQSMLRDADEP
jgi:D(-)-tartrate dehydratase